MAKKKTEFICQSCGAKFPKWSGKCLQCGEWDSLTEEAIEQEKNKNWVSQDQKVYELSEIKEKDDIHCWQTEVNEFDRVLGGGIVKNSIGILGGEPGIGKSTLILQLLARLVKLGKSVLYVSGEESAQQIFARADRLIIEKKGIHLLINSNLESILLCLEKVEYDFVVIDSIQTIYSDQISSSPGTVSQVRETTSKLLRLAKNNGPAFMLVGHVTKEGSIAGPKTFEHMVDYVLYLEGEKEDQRRILRSVKNRFGSVNEIGLFRMTPKGLTELSNPNAHILNEGELTGVTLFPGYEGNRLILHEIQLLVSENPQRNPARTAVGIDVNRLKLVVAVLEKYLGLNLNELDIYLKLAGGFKVNESGIDLAIAAALISSHRNRPLPANSLYLGELSLTGEFKAVLMAEERIKECDRLGFKKIFVPKMKHNLESKLDIIQTKNIDHLSEEL